MIVNKFERLSKNIWNKIELAARYGTIFGEETITDTILLNIARQNYFDLRIIQTPKHKESKQGTDWEWFVGSDWGGWIRFAIQAKKVNPKTFRYDNLNHKVGTSANKDTQLNILRIFSEANGAVPLYNFYNYFPTVVQNKHWNCSEPFEKELLGWTFTPLRFIEEIIHNRGHRNFDAIHSLTPAIPIRCLFGCPNLRLLYKNVPNSSLDGDFLGEPYRKLSRLPDAFNYYRKIRGATVVLDDFPENIYNSQIGIYPKRIAIIELPDINNGR